LSAGFLEANFFGSIAMSNAEEYPQFLLVVGGEKRFVTRSEAQNLLFTRDDVRIDGCVQVDPDYIVTLGEDNAEEEIYEAVSAEQDVGQ
jgi:hypothetical protein